MNEIDEIVMHYQAKLMDLLPGILISFAVLVIGYVIARLIKYSIFVLFKYISKLSGQRGGSDYKKAGSFIGASFFWLIMFASVLLITDYLGLTLLTGWFQNILQYMPNIIAAIFIIFAAILLGNLVSNLMTSVGNRTGFQYSQTLVKIVRFLFITLATVIALDQIGIEISLIKDIIDIILAALLFGAALAFGLGARTSISNILASFYVRKMYTEGDQIQIGKTTGRIISINTNSVVLENAAGQVNIPAKEFNETTSYLLTTD